MLIIGGYAISLDCGGEGTVGSGAVWVPTVYVATFFSSLGIGWIMLMLGTATNGGELGSIDAGVSSGSLIYSKSSNMTLVNIF